MIKVKIELRFIGPEFSGKQKEKVAVALQESVKQGLTAINQSQDKFTGRFKAIGKDGTMVIECREKGGIDGIQKE